MMGPTGRYGKVCMFRPYLRVHISPSADTRS